MKECTGQELQVGDIVLFVARGYRHLYWGRVQRLTPKTVLVRYYTNSQIEGKGPYRKEFRCTPDQLVKIEMNRLMDCSVDEDCPTYFQASTLVSEEILQILVHQIENCEEENNNE